MTTRTARSIYHFTFDDRYLALDVYSGQVYRIDEPTHALLSLETVEDESMAVRALEDSFPPDTVREVYRELKALGWLHAEERPDIGEAASPSTAITQLAMYVTDRCNLRCTYCYEAGECSRAPGGHMNRDTAERSVDFLLERSGPSKSCAISFFGGEPLLNFPLIRHVVEYAESRAADMDKHIGFTVDTNGTLLTDEMISFFENRNIAVGISLDGPPESNDANRVFPDGTGSYERVMSRVRKLKRSGRDVGARMTLTSSTLRFLPAVEHLLEAGFDRVSLDSDSGAAGVWTGKDRESLKSEFERAARLFVKNAEAGASFHFNNLISLMQAVHQRRRQRYHCGAGIWYLAVAPEGAIYPCQRVVGADSLCLGSVHDGFSGEWTRQILSRPVEVKQPCSECWARYLCGGGCMYRAWRYSGDPFQPDPEWCDLTKHVLRLAMAAYADIRSRNREGVLSGIDHGPC